MIDELALMNEAASKWRSAYVDLTPYFTPLNLAAERRRFVETLRVQDPPVFEYSTRDLTELDSVRQTIDWFESNASGLWAELALFDLQRSHAAAAALVSRDAERITEASVRWYGQPPPDLLQSAIDVGRQPSPTSSDRSISADQVAARLRAALSRIDHTWQVEIRSLSARISVQSQRRTIAVDEGSLFSPEEILRLVVHEIGCHVQRAVNGERQRLAFAAHGVGAYITTEEGLATWLEERSGYLDKQTYHRYAVRFLAAQRVPSVGWTELIDELLSLTTPGEAFDIAARVKRGLTEPSQPGGWVKDHVYWTGHALVSEFLKEKPGMLQLLLSGKFALSQLDALNWAVKAGFVEPMPIVLDFGQGIAEGS